MKKLYFIVSAIFLIFVGCEKNNPVGPGGEKSTEKKLLKIINTNPSSVGEITKTQKLVIYFDKQIDRNSVAPSTFSVKSPGIIPGSRWVEGKVVSFVPYEPYQAGGKVTLYIGINAKDSSSVDTLIHFNVKADPLPVYIKPVESWPANNAVDVSSETIVIKQRFNEDISNIGQVEVTLSDNPYSIIKEPVYTSVAHGDTIITTISGLFADELPSATQVTVKYSGVRGAHNLQAPVTLAFTVEDYEPFKVSDYYQLRDVAVLPDGRTIVVGIYGELRNPTNKGVIDIFSKSGKLLKEIISGDNEPYFDIDITPEGDMYIDSNDDPRGQGGGNSIIHHYNADFVLQEKQDLGPSIMLDKMYANGNLYCILAAKTIMLMNLTNNTFVNLGFVGRFMYYDSHGDIIVVGDDESNHLYIAKYSTDFTLYWQRTYHKYDFGTVILPRVVELNSGNYAVFASFNGQPFVVQRIDYTPQGEQQSPIDLPDNYEIHDVIKCPMYDYVLVQGEFHHGTRIVINPVMSTFVILHGDIIYIHDFSTKQEIKF